MAALTVERAKELAKIGGFVRLPKMDGAPHRGSGQVIAVINEHTLEVKPWHHRRTDTVPLAKCSEHKSKTAKHQEIYMDRVREARTGRETTIADAIISSAGRANASVQLGPATPMREAFVVMDPTRKLVWGGPEGKNRGFHASIDKAATYSDSASAARSIGKLRHAKEWKSSINVDALTPMPKSTAMKMLASRQSPTSQPPVAAAPMIAEAPAPPLPVVHANGNGHQPKPPRVIEVKPVEAPRLPDPPVVPNPPTTPEPSQSVMELVASLSQDYRDFEDAIGMAEEAQRNIMRKVGLIQSGMSNRLAVLKG